jgi:hypothetical protein
MPYSLRTYDGTSLVTIADGSVDDQVTTSLFLIGKNVTGYGTRQNENVLYLLENFANVNAPGAPLTGQLWYDKSPESPRLKLYDGGSWKGLAVVDVSESQPTGLTQGDLWFDSSSNQLYAKSGTGTDFTLIGPEVTAGFGVTKLVSKSILDINSGTHAIINVTVDDSILGIFSADPVAVGGNEVEYGLGFTNLIRGFNLSADATIKGLDITSRSTTESIDAQWNFTSGIKIGDGNTIQYDSNGNLVLESASANVIANAQSILPGSVNTNIGSTAQPFNIIYASNITSGSAIKTLSLTGDMTVQSNSKLRPYLDNNVVLGTSTGRWKNIYSYSLSAGSADSSGAIEGNWELTAGSKLTTPVIQTPRITSGSPTTVGNVEGDWRLDAGSKWQATALIDGNRIPYEPNVEAILNTIALRSSTGQLKATEFVGPLTGNVTGNLTGNVTGNTAGTHTGPVVGNVTGNVTGDTAGTHNGPVVGNVTGNLTGNVSGNVSGNITGNTAGTHTGPVVGNVNGNVTGNLTGNVSGNVTGNLTGNTAGTHTGPVVGNVTGNLTGNVSGNLAGTTVSATTINTNDVNVLGRVFASAGAGSNNGIQFPADPGGGSGDTAWIRYYAPSLDRTVLELGASNDGIGSSSDSIYLNATGGVSINRQFARYALDVNGDIACNVLRGTATDSQLWNGSNKFISTSAPTNDQGVNGDFWFQREA